MQNEKLKPKDIDKIFNHLLALAGSSTCDPAFFEPLVLFLDELSFRSEPAVFDHYCTLYSPVIIYAVREIAASLIGYDALSRIPTLIARIREIVPNAVGPDIAARLKHIYEQLAFYELFLGNEERAHKHLYAAERLDARELRLQEKLDSFREEFMRLQARSSADEIKFVTVYTGKGLGGLPGVGKIVKSQARMEITGEWSILKRFKHIIAFEDHKLQLDNPFDTQIGRAIDFAEGNFIQRLKVGEIERLPREYHFSLLSDEGSSNLKRRFTGGSAGLAFAILSLALIDKLGVRRDQRLIKGNVAFTGTIDGNGSVSAVDESTIGAKARSVFLSTCDYFVLPKDNFNTAVKHSEKLKNQFPKRLLELVPITHVLEAYDDERIVQRKRNSAAYLIFKKAKRRRKHLLLIFSCLITVITLLLLVPARLKKEIVYYRYENGSLYFENEYRYTFERYDVGYRIVESDEIDEVPVQDNTIDGMDTGAKSRRIYLDDTDGNDSRELLFISVESDSNDTNPCGKLHVHLFSNSGDLIWHVSWLDTLFHTYGEESRTFRKFYYCLDELVDLDGDGYKELVVSMSQRSWYPGVIARINLRDGSFKSFVHNGYITIFTTGDFDLDGKKEIVAAGLNNGLDAGGVIVVLDPMIMNGSSPDAFRFKYEGFSNDIARYYIKLPKSALFRVPDFKESKPEVQRINIEEDGTLSFGVVENEYALLYYFDEKWRCSGVVATDPYKFQYRLLQKPYDLPELSQHLNQLRTMVEYWTGEDWTRDPTINRSYNKILSQGKIQ